MLLAAKPRRLQMLPSGKFFVGSRGEAATSESCSLCVGHPNLNDSHNRMVNDVETLTQGWTHNSYLRWPLAMPSGAGGGWSSAASGRPQLPNPTLSGRIPMGISFQTRGPFSLAASGPWCDRWPQPDCLEHRE